MCAVDRLAIMHLYVNRFVVATITSASVQGTQALLPAVAVLENVLAVNLLMTVFH